MWSASISGHDYQTPDINRQTSTPGKMNSALSRVRFALLCVIRRRLRALLYISRLLTLFTSFSSTSRAEVTLLSVVLTYPLSDTYKLEKQTCDLLFTHLHGITSTNAQIHAILTSLAKTFKGDILRYRSQCLCIYIWASRR